jgi:hypothetical protein
MPAPLSDSDPVSLPEIDKIWAEEARHRSQACDEGRMKTVSFEELFGSKMVSHQHRRPDYWVERVKNQLD